MRYLLPFAAAFLASATFAQAPAAGADGLDKPKGIPISTWVREDLFAGYLDNDITRFERGMRKVDRILAANPQAADAYAWRGSGRMYLAVRDLEAGDTAGFEKRYAEAKADFARVEEVVKRIPQYGIALDAIGGGSYTLFAGRMPEADRAEAWRKALGYYTSLKARHGSDFDKLPAHFKGEVLAGIATATARTGNSEQAMTLAREIVQSMPGTPYAVFAGRWVTKPETMATTKITCVSCHDAGRLDPALSAARR